MRRLLLVLILTVSLSLIAGEPVRPGRIIKTLPLLLDTKGQAAISPSLFDRDAYQAYLREHTNEVSADSISSGRPNLSPTSGNCD